MGESVREMLEYLCRLCARTDQSCVNVFSSDGDKHFIQKKIRLCLPVIVEEQDEMPRQICLSCLNKLESTYEFYTTCIYAQSTIQRLLRAESLHDHDYDHVNKRGSETKEKSRTSFSLDQYLKRKIEPTDTGKSIKVQRTDNLENVVANNNVCEETTKPPDSEASASGGISNGAVVAKNNSEVECANTAGGSNNISAAAPNNSDIRCATSSEMQKPKLRVKTTSELRQIGQTAIVTDCVTTLLSLQNSSAQSVAVPTTRQSTCVSASHSSSIVCSQSAVPQSSHSASSLPQPVKSSLPQYVKKSSSSKGGTSWSSVAQNVNCVSPVVQLGKNSTVPPVLRFSSSSSQVLQTGTSSFSVPQNAAALLPLPKNTTVSLPVPNNVSQNATASLKVTKNATVALSVPQNITNSPSVQQYSLSVPSSLSSGCPILPKVSQFIIVPNTYASTPTFTAAGTNTVAVLTQALPSNVSLVGDLSVPLGSATTLVTPQTTQPPVPVSMQTLSVSTTAALPLATSALPLVRTVPLQVTQKPSNPVMTSLKSAPTVISQSSTSDSVVYSVLNKNSQAVVISSNSHVTATTSTANVSSKAGSQLSKVSQNLKMSSSSSASPSGKKPAKRASTEGKLTGLRSDTAVQGAGNTASAALSKQSGSAQKRTNVEAVSKAVSHHNILSKPAAPIVTSANGISSNSPSPLRCHRTYSASNSKKRSLLQPAKMSSDTESTQKDTVLLGLLTQGSSSQRPDSNKGVQKTILCYSDQAITKVNSVPTDKTATAPITASLSQATVPTQPMYSVSIVPAQQSKEGTTSVIIKKTNYAGTGNTQLPVANAVSNARNESQLSETKTQQKTAVPRQQPSRGLPPPPPTVPLNSLSISENRTLLANTERADAQKGEATGTSSGHQVSRESSQRQSMKNVEVPQKSSISSQANKSGLTPKPRGPVATATVSPFNPTSRPASDPLRQSPVDPSPKEEVQPLTPSSQPPSAAGPRRSPATSPPAAIAKEECPYCHVVFPVDILIHHKTLHYREKFYTCIDCDKNFVTEKGLESHRCQKESKG